MALATTTTTLVTAEEFLARPAAGRTELLEGRVVEMAPAGEEHSFIGTALVSRLSVWANAARAGRVYGADLGITVSRDPDTVLSPDGAFIAAARIGSGVQRGFLAVVPDLIVEVVSPSDRRVEVLAKVVTWLEAGAQVVWLVWPESQTVQVWTSPDYAVTVPRDATLTCPALLPGFELPLAEVFPAD